MVVTRRTPVPPAAASRTPSSQPIPRLGKKASTDTSDKSSPLATHVSAHDAGSKANGTGPEPPSGTASKSAKVKGKAQKKKGGKKKSDASTGFVELLFRAFLLWFTIYTLSICPQDEQLKTPICRGLAEYRRLVIEPYILPPIQQALAHPSVSPYVEKARPYADYAVRTAKPVAVRAQKEFTTRVVPQWNKRVVPLYYKYAVPQLLKLDAQTAPYRTRAEQEYKRVLAPYVQRTVSILVQIQQKAQPYVVLAAEKAHQGYQAARPYARPLWEKIKELLSHLTAFLGEQRRQLVDPHVQKIWEHVKELSNGKPGTSSSPSPRSSASLQVSKVSSRISKASAKISSSSPAVSSTAAVNDPSKPVFSSTGLVAAEIGPDVKSTSSQTAEAESTVSSSSAEVTVSSLVSAASEAAPTSATSLVSSSSVVDDFLETASSISQETVASSLAESATTVDVDAEAPQASTSSSSLADQPTVVASENLNAEAEASVTVTETLAVPETTHVAPTPAPTEVSEDNLFDDPDMAFFEEIGLTDDLLRDPAPEVEPETDWEAEVQREAERRARAEKTARDRADIERRHTHWEKEVEAAVARNKKALRKALVAIRKAAVAQFKQSTAIREEVDSLLEDAEKFLRGAEKYLANLQKEKRTLEEKQAVWERVVGKLDDKFQERLEQTETIVNGWYQSVLNQELAEVHKLTEEVKEIADQGQADIGLDYAYLDDVTVQDWTRYHDLIRRSENFTELAQSVQDGSHPSPPINPIIPVLEELQTEVEDAISGFNARLRKIKRTGARAFGTTEDAVEEGDDTVSILPIDEPEPTADAEVPPVTVGRGKAEVEAAFERVEQAQAAASSDTPVHVEL